MNPGDLVLLGGHSENYYRATCALLDIPSDHVDDDPGVSGQISARELCIVLETRDGWLRVMGSRTSSIGWVRESRMDEVMQNGVSLD